jgi:hypothetical protein
MMNPYEVDPERIPTTDLYAEVPLYGRYRPKPDDFRVDLQHVNSKTTDSLRYLELVVSLCTKEIRIYPADEGGRDVFALGSVIVKSSHLHEREGAQITEIGFSYADANELQVIALAKTVLNDIKVPEIYFAGKVLSLTSRLSGSTTQIFSDQWSPSAGPRKASRCWIICRMVLSI